MKLSLDDKSANFALKYCTVNISLFCGSGNAGPRRFCFVFFSLYEPNENLKQAFTVKNCEKWGGKKHCG